MLYAIAMGQIKTGLGLSTGDNTLCMTIHSLKTENHNYSSDHKNETTAYTGQAC